MIKQFRVQNYKALRDVTLNLTPIHVLIGPNDSGKTSLLEAVTALCLSVDHPLADSFLGQWEGHSLVTRDGKSNVGLFARSDEVEYGIHCAFSSQGRRCDLAGRSCRIPESRQDSGETPNNETTTSNQRWVLQPLPSQQSGSTEVGELEKAARVQAMVLNQLSGVEYYRLIPSVLALPVAPDSRLGFHLEVSGFGLARYLDELLGQDRMRFDQLEARFRELFRDVKSIKLVSEPGYRVAPDRSRHVPVLGKAEGKGIYFELESAGFAVSASQMSDGMLLVLAYLALLHSPTPPRVLLIEEPENGIHPKRLQEVLAILRQLVSEQQHTQIILTTHSPYVLDSFQPEEVTLCRKNADGAVSVRRLSESKTVREQIDIFSLGEIWTAAGDEDLAIPVDAAAVVEEVAP